MLARRKKKEEVDASFRKERKAILEILCKREGKKRRGKGS